MTTLVTSNRNAKSVKCFLEWGLVSQLFGVGLRFKISYGFLKSTTYKQSDILKIVQVTNTQKTTRKRKYGGALIGSMIAGPAGGLMGLFIGMTHPKTWGTFAVQFKDGVEVVLTEDDEDVLTQLRAAVAKLGLSQIS